MHLLSILALGVVGPLPGAGQLNTLTLDARTPLELTLGEDEGLDLVLVGALFASPPQISVFTGPGHGDGPYSEEVAVASGQPYFALSRQIHCRGGVCYFTAVNGVTQNVELFFRGTGGTWLRSVVTHTGVFFNSDMGLTKGTVTVLGYDSVNREQVVFRASETDLIFSQVAARPGAIDAVFGGLRASLATDPETFDFQVLLEDAPANPLTLGWARTGEGAEVGPGRHVRTWGVENGLPHESVLDDLLTSPSGNSADQRESVSKELCGFKIFVWIDENLNVSFELRNPSGNVLERKLGVESAISLRTLAVTKTKTPVDFSNTDLTFSIRFPPDVSIDIHYFSMSGTTSTSVFRVPTWSHPPGPSSLGTTTGPAGGEDLLFVTEGSVLLRRYQPPFPGIFRDDFESGDLSQWSGVLP